MAIDFSSIKNILIWIKNSEVKNILFGVIGGFYFSLNFEPRLKHLWLGLNLLSGGVSGVMVIGYFIAGSHTDWKSILYACCIAESVIFGTVFSPLFTYHFRHELDLMLHLNTRENKRNVEHVDHLQRMKNHFVFMNIIFFLLFVITYLGFILYPLFAANDDYYNDPNFYLIPNPLIRNVDTVKKFMSLSVILCLIYTVPLIMCVCFEINILIVSYEFYVAFTILCSRMAEFSRHSEMTFEEINEKYASLHSKIGSIFYKQQIEAERQNLMRNIVGAVKDYQKLSR